jgi:phosphomannomutase
MSSSSPPPPNTNNPTSSFLTKSAQQWSLFDPNPITKKYIEQQVLINNTTKLEQLFSSRIEFGTAGLRAEFGPGPMRMNDLVVIQTAQGICQCLDEQNIPKQAGFVIGYDHRFSPEWQCSSLSFALATAAVFISRGRKVYLFENFVATPLVPFAIQHLRAGGGVMITASHNPKNDAGYKMYWTNACQIISPIDDAVSKCILQNLEPWKDVIDLLSIKNYEEKIRQACTVSMHNPELFSQKLIVNAYLNTAKQKLCRNPSHINQDFLGKHVCYTPMHGVGLPFAQAMFNMFGFTTTNLHVVKEQAQPDATFSTVEFPNPEEKGALTLAMKYAEKYGLDLILANDPDADRLAVAERINNNTAVPSWKVFTGDEIAMLLGWWEIEHFMISNNKQQQLQKRPAMVVSAVSSMFLKHFGEKVGVTVFETLTGFKYIGNLVLDLRKQGYQVLFSYEEAIGFCVGDVIVDKDGLTAAAVFAEMGAWLRNVKKMTCMEKLTELRQTYGWFIQKNGYIRTSNPKEIFINIRGQDGRFPFLLGRKDGGHHIYRVIHVRDLAKGQSGIDTMNIPTLQPTLPRTSMMITFYLDSNIKITLRASGTEPKLKYYVEAFGNNETEVEQILNDVVNRIVIGDLLLLVGGHNHHHNNKMESGGGSSRL